jgi:hypothetical protein
MRCVIVNGATPKADAFCAHCGSKIADTYVRELGSGLLYCDYRCYSVAVEMSVPALGYRQPALGAWTLVS